MRPLRLLLGVGAAALVGVALLLGAFAASPAGSGQALQVKHAGGVVTGSAQTRALLVIELASYDTRTGELISPRTSTIISLRGKRLPVPARVRKSPSGLSPDGRMVAAFSAGTFPDGVLVGAVRGGSMRTVLRGSCPVDCPLGADPSFAWSPDSQQLAAAANPPHGPTLLKLFDRNGRAVRSFTLPRTDPEQDGRVYHNVISWSPDGARLLLERRDYIGSTAVVVLDISTGRLRTFGQFLPVESPTPAWSPDGRFVAITSHGSMGGADNGFAVIDAASARLIISPTLTPDSTVWAPDSRSLFGDVTSHGSSRIYRFYLTGRRAQVIGASADWLIPRVALTTGLVYSTRSRKGSPEVLHLHDFTTGHGTSLMSSRAGIEAVLPLSRIP